MINTILFYEKQQKKKSRKYMQKHKVAFFTVNLPH